MSWELVLSQTNTVRCYVGFVTHVAGGTKLRVRNWFWEEKIKEEEVFRVDQIWLFKIQQIKFENNVLSWVLVISQMNTMCCCVRFVTHAAGDTVRNWFREEKEREKKGWGGSFRAGGGNWSAHISHHIASRHWH